MKLIQLTLFNLVQAVLQNSFYTISGPDSTYLSGTNSLSPILTTRRQVTPLSKGDKILIYFRLLKRDGQTDSLKTFTATFYPRVDDYTTMSIPNSYSLLDTLASSQNYADVGMIVYYAGRYFEVPYKRVSINRFGQTYHVPGRTVLIQLKNGLLESIDWAFTQCAFTECICVDQICGDLCVEKNCNATIRLAWAGTDASGQVLQSYCNCC
jgi:hypothetical protein